MEILILNNSKKNMLKISFISTSLQCTYLWF